ncbi:MAG TPA: hypothetical protein VFB14_01280 [Bryobacteraceae bacterium]|jgi:hypothetical protein|nr:hypothetical protein [Bryobacteraceae bacterium]
MATISGATLDIANVNATTVILTVSYTLTANNVEQLAGTVFTENIQVIGDDPGILTDTVVAALPAQNFAVSTATPTVVRTRTRNLPKSALNEDPLFLANGAEQPDEILARIALAYAANAPATPAIPPPATTNTVVGAWR